MKKITLLGSTGSIGLSTLDVIASNPKKFKAVALAAGGNVEVLAGQIRQFRPKLVSVRSRADAQKLRDLIGSIKVRILYDSAGLEELAAFEDADMVLSAISGAAGLMPTLSAIEAGKDIALANKETLVMAGSIVTRRAARKKVRLLPVDSEHSAIFQCLAGQKREALKRIVLTASGGPFWSFSVSDLKKVTLEQALKHPRWTMGRKITIDSASLMNKGLEIIEAKWLFDLDISRIDVLIHPQSIVHSLIEMIDGAMIAQLGIADMRIPIAYALTYPDRMVNPLPALDLAGAGRLDFYPPDMKKFPCLALACEAGRLGGTAPAVLNAANEEAVGAFLQKKIRFCDLPIVIEKVMGKHAVINNPSLSALVAADGEARREAVQWISTHMRG